jgi:hypothetical protein
MEGGGRERAESGCSHLHAKKLSSSSRLEGAGKGAPGASCVGSRTYPSPLPKGFKDCNLERKGVVDELVLAGISGSLRDQPNEFILSRNEFDAILLELITPPLRR